MQVADLFNEVRLSPVTPKLLSIREIGVDHAIKYNEDWHSRLPKTVKGNLLRNRHYVFYGAEYLGNCFGCAIWTTPVANNRMSTDYIWLELRRLAIPDDAPKYTATFMIAKMVKAIKKKYPEVTRLVSYQDTEVHKGTIYAASNWKLDTVSKFQEWSSETRKRNELQTKSDKIRWIYDI